MISINNLINSLFSGKEDTDIEAQEARNKRLLERLKTKDFLALKSR